MLGHQCHESILAELLVGLVLQRRHAGGREHHAVSRRQVDLGVLDRAIEDRPRIEAERDPFGVDPLDLLLGGFVMKERSLVSRAGDPHAPFARIEDRHQCGHEESRAACRA